MSNKQDLRDNPEVVKKMTSLLAQGAAMLDKTCPVCGLPLFQTKKGEIVCPVHGKVYVVESEEEAKDIEVDETLKSLEYFISIKIRENINKDDIDEISDLLKIMESTERIIMLRKDIFSKQNQKEDKK
ncbi:putative Zn-finger containing protein [Caldisphaera lagunensis DSM 15908]|uniref:Putative Zn-finger containing protein n=1 Tax=Caldisphaera lagunensis (strain DSM 15908 / JCM 11604 / ANMR 0165 / IC-154) TaxID=1056495 RepID=L0A9F2_CALLD|nr:Sjogren's syndrome/scleroderma autoantigen 1 family protein [Caldisphaera lagunensis]AFZ70049.1 putative Zn-finger containing protein [Caldisphaera lagunensis DSM 15908]